jgi:phage gp36-like protein
MMDRFDADRVNTMSGSELAQLTDRTNMPPSVIDMVRLQQSLDDATAEMDSYLAMAYTMPIIGCLTAAGTYIMPTALIRYCCDIARYTLYDNRASDKEVRRRYDDALVWLGKIAKRELALSCPVPASLGTLVTSQIDRIAVCSDPRIFTQNTLQGYRSNTFPNGRNNYAC